MCVQMLTGGGPAYETIKNRSVLWISHKARVYLTDGQTDGRTDGQNYDSQDRVSIAASRGKNGKN